MSDSTVAIVGGGIAGLCAAHHLRRAGVKSIVVYEKSDDVGGKARSQYPRASNGANFPGEHGFRFFPHFYRHLLETLRQIRVGNETAYDRLIGPRTAAIAYKQRRLLEVARPVRIEPSLGFIRTTVDVLMRKEISSDDALQFATKLLMFATSCEERREFEYDKITWTKFTGAEDGDYAPEFLDVVIRASQNLSAMRAEKTSAATIGAITLQLLFLFSDTEKADAILQGPTDEMWLRDWRAFLEAQGGVRIETCMEVTALDFDANAGKITGLRFGGGRRTADYYVCAVPLEAFVKLLNDDMKALDPVLAGLPGFCTHALGHMSGLQFFLRRRTSITQGHVHYPGTPFALTSVSQAQFWRTPPEQRPGTPDLKDVLSVIISEWDKPGTEHRTAREYVDRTRLAEEVWHQMEAALPAGTLSRDDIITSHLDANIGLNPFDNSSPLLIHPPDQRRQRPDAETAISNLFLASDFVRTYTDLATMEGADEAARRAARAILADMGFHINSWPRVLPLDEGSLFTVGKMLDSWWFRLQRPHVMSEPGTILEELEREGDAPPRGLIDVDRASLRELTRSLPSLERHALTIEKAEKWERFLRGDWG